MKKIANILLLLVFAAGIASCAIDNYDAPDAALEGVIYDLNGNKLETAQGKGNVCIRIFEDSYANGDSTITVISRELNVKQDGTFSNSKLFAGTYTMYPYMGCFYPLPDSLYQKVELKSGKTTKVEFTVTPYVTLKWAKKPWQDADSGYIHATIEFEQNPNPKPGGLKPDVEYVKFFISTTEKVGDHGDNRYTTDNIEIKNGHGVLGFELTSKERIWYTQPLWIRVGISSKDAYKKYCYSSIIKLDATGWGKPQGKLP